MFNMKHLALCAGLVTLTPVIHATAAHIAQACAMWAAPSVGAVRQQHTGSARYVIEMKHFMYMALRLLYHRINGGSVWIPACAGMTAGSEPFTALRRLTL